MFHIMLSEQSKEYLTNEMIENVGTTINFTPENESWMNSILDMYLHSEKKETISQKEMCDVLLQYIFNLPYTDFLFIE